MRFPDTELENEVFVTESEDKICAPEGYRVLLFVSLVTTVFFRKQLFARHSWWW